MGKKKRKRPAKPQEPTAPRPRSDSAVRYYSVVLAALAGIAVVLQILSLQPLIGTFWGFHFYAFIPLPIAIVNWLGLAAAAVVLLARTSPSFGAPGPIASARPVITAIVLAAIWTAIFIVFKSQQDMLGDAHPLSVGLPRGERFHPRQPVTMWLQQHIYQALGGFFRGEQTPDSTVAFQTTAAGSIALGFLFVLISVALGFALTRGRRHNPVTPWLVASIFVAQGYALLFYGYVENYTFYTVAVALYVLTALLSLQGRVTVQLPAIVFFLTMALHLSTLSLLPSLVFLIWIGLADKKRRGDALLGLLVTVAGFFVLHWTLRMMSPGFSLWAALRDILDIASTGQGGGQGITYLFSWKHTRDFFNEQFLIGPLAAFLFLPALLYMVWSHRRWDRTAVFLTIAAGAYLGGSWAMSEPLLGYARDWDLFAPAGVCYVAAGMYFMIIHFDKSPRLPRVLTFGLIFSLLQLAPYVRITHSQELAVERFKYLPLGFGRTEVVVGNYYLRHDQPEEAEVWFKRALEVYPYNANAYGFLGQMYDAQGRYEDAAAALKYAVQLRPDKPQFHNNYARALIELERYEEALPEIEWVLSYDPDNVRYWRVSKSVYARLERQDKVDEANRHLLELCEQALAKNPRHLNALLESGILLSELGDVEQAYSRFRQALALAPDSDAALFNTAMALTRLGRGAEAVPLLERFLELYPEHPQAEAARQQLGG